MSPRKFTVVTAIAFELVTLSSLAVAARVTVTEFESGTWHWWSEVLFWFGMLGVQPYVFIAQSLDLPRWFGWIGLPLNALGWGAFFSFVRSSVLRMRLARVARGVG